MSLSSITLGETVLKLFLAVTSWLSTLLSRQKRLDFKPKTDTDLFESERTEPCAACCIFVSRVRNIIVGSVSGKNQDVLLTDIGVTFHRLASLTATELVLMNPSAFS